jgi:hypothetical protein
VADLPGTERIDGGHVDRPRRFYGCAAIAGDDERDERGEQRGTAHGDLRVMALVVDGGARPVERPGRSILTPRGQDVTEISAMG